MKNRSSYFFSAAVVVVTGLVCLPGCSSKFTDYCDKAQGCIGGNDKDKAACVAQGNEAKNEAAAYGCSTEFDAVSDCEIASSTCQSGKFTSGTACASQNTALSLCTCQASSRGAKGQCGTAGGVTPVTTPSSSGIDCNVPGKCSADVWTEASKKSCEDEKAGKCSAEYATAFACVAAKQTCGADNKTNNNDKIAQDCGTEINGYVACKSKNPPPVPPVDAGR